VGGKEEERRREKKEKKEKSIAVFLSNLISRTTVKLWRIIIMARATSGREGRGEGVGRGGKKKS